MPTEEAEAKLVEFGYALFHAEMKYDKKTPNLQWTDEPRIVNEITAETLATLKGLYWRHELVLKIKEFEEKLSRTILPRPTKLKLRLVYRQSKSPPQTHMGDI